jgi:hypothetical protein
MPNPNYTIAPTKNSDSHYEISLYELPAGKQLLARVGLSVCLSLSLSLSLSLPPCVCVCVCVCVCNAVDERHGIIFFVISKGF